MDRPEGGRVKSTGDKHAGLDAALGAGVTARLAPQVRKKAGAGTKT